MNIRDFKERLFTEGTKAGFTDMEIFVSNSSNFRLQVFNKEVDNYSLSQIRGISFRGIYNGKMGYAYTEIADDESITF